MSELLIQSGDTLLKPPPTVQPDNSFDFLQILRLLFYLLVAIKLIELSFLRKKKHSLKERVYRKFLFAHQQLLKQFTEEDKAMMQHTLNNTIKNANVDYSGSRVRQQKIRKRVNFSVEKNSYYEPKQWKNDNEDEDIYLDVENPKEPPFENVQKLDVHSKMIEEEFGQRQNLEKINEQEQEIEIQASKLTQDTQITSENLSNQPSQVSELPIQTKDSLLSLRDSATLKKQDSNDESKLSLKNVTKKDE